MKTITVTNEMYDFLMNLAKEIKNQDNRGTRFPYYYQVQEEVNMPTGDEMGEEVWVKDGEIHLQTDDDIKEAVFEFLQWDFNDPKKQIEYDNMSTFDIEDILLENYRQIFVTKININSNVFLTEKACNDYIEKNRHNLSNPKSFLFYADRNNEMNMLIKFLQTLTKTISKNE